MKTRMSKRHGAWIRSLTLLATVVAIGGGLAAWKVAAAQKEAAAGAGQPEHAELVTAAEAVERMHRGSATAIGTVVATRSVTLRNEVPGTVRYARLVPGQVVEAGTVLLAFDGSVEEAELEALETQAALAEATLARVQRMFDRRAASAIELDNARAERDVARAVIARTRAVIARKTIRAPFRARVGISDVHPGQFLDAGSLVTTLQGVDDAAHVDFAVAQEVAAGLDAGAVVEVVGEGSTMTARVVAVDSRVDPATRSARVRARIEGTGALPGASVRVRVPVGEPRRGVAVPVSALRRGPGGDQVFVLEPDERGALRAQVRPVEAGPVVGAEVVILAGLRAGERVAASGSFKLREAALVHLADGELARAGETR